MNLVSRKTRCLIYSAAITRRCFSRCTSCFNTITLDKQHVCLDKNLQNTIETSPRRRAVDAEQEESRRRRTEKQITIKQTTSSSKRPLNICLVVVPTPREKRCPDVFCVHTSVINLSPGEGELQVCWDMSSAATWRSPAHPPHLNFLLRSITSCRNHWTYYR